MKKLKNKLILTLPEFRKLYNDARTEEELHGLKPEIIISCLHGKIIIGQPEGLARECFYHVY